MSNGHQLTAKQIVWPDESEKWAKWSTLPDGWTIWLYVQMELDGPGGDDVQTVSLEFCDAGCDCGLALEMDDCIEQVDRHLVVFLNDIVRSRDLEGTVKQAMETALGRNARLRVQRREPDGRWEVRLDTGSAGYRSQATVKRFPWEDEG